MLLHELLTAARRRCSALDRAIVRGGAAGVDVTSVCCDSRAARPGALFCCLRGATVDGHDFAAAARDSGAVALLVERTVDVQLPQVEVPSSAAAAGALASAVVGDPSDALSVVGVTGTNGKTTVTYLVEAIALAAGHAPGVIGTVETRYAGRSEQGVHTTPDACALQETLARMRAAGVQIIAMEVSSHALDQRRADGTHFAVACFTNLSQDHLDYHGTMEAYGAAKARLFQPEFAAHAVVNVDDAFGRALAATAAGRGLPVTTFGTSAHADVQAVDVQVDRDGSHGLLAARGHGTVSFDLELVGAYNVDNALAAAAVGLALGIDLSTVAEGLGALRGVPGRLERVDAGRGNPLVFVDYAHTPDALERTLQTVRPFAGPPDGRVIVVFGCGGDRDAAKRPAMGRVATAGSDLAVLTSDNPRSEDPDAIVDAVLAGIEDRYQVIVEPDRRMAIATALEAAHEHDVVLIAGKGHETGQTIEGLTLPFDDRVVAREVLAARAPDRRQR